MISVKNIFTVFLHLSVLSEHTEKICQRKKWFQQQLWNYMQIYLSDCSFTISVTDQYDQMKSETAVFVKKFIKKKKRVKYLYELLVCMRECEKSDLTQQINDFSIIRSSRRRSIEWMLFEIVRFINHYCDMNIKIMCCDTDMMKVIVMQDINTDNKIIIYYDNDYFEENNYKCLCQICEFKNSWIWKYKFDKINNIFSSTVFNSRCYLLQKRKHSCSEHSTINSEIDEEDKILETC